MAVINTLLAIAQALLIAYFGWALKDRLDSALKERQTSVQERLATVQALEKMSGLLTEINKESIKDEERERIVLQVAMYGSDAIYPLFVMAVSKNAYSPSTAIPGLRLLALQHRMEVCALLLEAPTIPKLVNAIREVAVQDLTKELKCQLPQATR